MVDFEEIVEKVNEADDLRPTRREMKRVAAGLERLGLELVKLAPERLKGVPLPDDVREAVETARRITSHEGRRRQLQYVGRLMRAVDEKPIRAALDDLNALDRRGSDRFQAIERWRDRLVVEGDVALDELLQEKPAGDRTALRTLARNAKVERAKGKTASSRALFRALRELFRDPAIAVSDDEDAVVDDGEAAHGAAREEE